MDCSKAMKPSEIVSESAITKGNEVAVCESKGPTAEVLGQIHGMSPVPEWVTCMMGCNKKLDENQPLVLLSCYHVICSDECLAKFKDIKTPLGDQLKCKVCCGPIPEQVLTTKVTIKSANLTSVTPSMNNVQVLCEYCVFDHPGVKLCVECPMILCTACADYHKIKRDTHLHKLSDDLQKQKRIELKRLVDLNLKCSKHPEESNKFRCFPCAIKFCSLCLPSHDGHDVKNLAAGAKDISKRIDLLQKNTDRRNQVVTPFLTKQASKENLDSVYQQMIKPIKEQFQLLLKALVGQYINCLEALKKDVNTRQECLEITLKKMKECGSQSQRILEVMKHLSKEKNSDTLIRVERELQPLFAAVELVDVQLDKNMDDVMGVNSVFLVNTDAINLSMQTVSHYMENKYVHMFRPKVADKTKALKGIKRNCDGEAKGSHNNKQSVDDSVKEDSSVPGQFLECGRGCRVINVKSMDKVPVESKKSKLAEVEVIDLEVDVDLNNNITEG